MYQNLIIQDVLIGDKIVSENFNIKLKKINLILDLDETLIHQRKRPVYSHRRDHRLAVGSSRLQPNEQSRDRTSSDSSE